jgi:glycosyltransferase involved in cell wall biosynthesis
MSTQRQQASPGSAEPSDGHPRVLMLGMGWFPATLGGLNRYYRSLFEQLSEARGVVIGPAGDAPESIAVLDDPETPLPRRLLDFWLAARRASAAAEVIDAHFALYAAAPLLLSKARDRPVVFHFHGPWAAENLAAGDGSRARYALRAALERRVLRRANAYVVLSSAFRRVLVERYGVRPWDVQVWTPGVALEQFTPGDRDRARELLRVDRGAFVAVCVRRLVPRMGIEVLLDAWERVQDTLPQGSTLLLVGDGPLRDALRRRTARAPLSDSVRLLGRLSESDLVEAYRCADVAIVPSVSLEGFGLVVPEAAACGTPSIVTEVGGLPEVTSPLDASLAVAPEDEAALGGRIEAAARGRLPTREATRGFAERFSWPALAERHRALHRRLIAGEHDERLRVVYLDHVARLSGGEIALMRLLTHFQDVNPHVILGEDGPLAGRLQEAGVSVEVLPIAPSARDLRRDTVRPGGASPTVALHTFWYALRLALRLRALRPDVVHTNSLKSGVYGSIAAKLAGVPVVWHVRDRIAEDYIPGAAVRLIRILIRHLADGVVANSTATLQTLPAAVRGRLSWVIPASVKAPASVAARPSAAASGPIDAGAWAYAQVPVDALDAGADAGAPDSSAVTFGMVGRIAPWKGQDLFLRAFAAAFPAGAERAVVVGSAMFGEEGYERELHALAASLGVAERVEFRGFREDIWPELASMDVLVHASVIPEPFGTVVLEGMAAGLAVVAADEGGPATTIADGETGRLFRSRDAESLAAAMRALRDDPLERRRLGTAARGAVSDYHPDVVARQLERVYGCVLTETRRDGAGTVAARLARTPPHEPAG